MHIYKCRICGKTSQFQEVIQNCRKQGGSFLYTKRNRPFILIPELNRWVRVRITNRLFEKGTHRPLYVVKYPNDASLGEYTAYTRFGVPEEELRRDAIAVAS